MPTSSRSLRLATALGAAALSACATTAPSMLDTAREGTSAEWNCPDSQITTAHRPDLRASATPPPDVAADPNRLALWEADVDSAPATSDRPKIVEVSGCGHYQFYSCFHWSGEQWVGGRHGGELSTANTSCTYIAPPRAPGTPLPAVSVDRIGVAQAARPADCALQLVPKGAVLPPNEGRVGRIFVTTAPGADAGANDIRQRVHPQACALGGDTIVIMESIVVGNPDGSSSQNIEFDVFAPQSF